MYYITSINKISDLNTKNYDKQATSLVDMLFAGMSDEDINEATTKVELASNSVTNTLRFKTKAYTYLPNKYTEPSYLLDTTIQRIKQFIDDHPNPQSEYVTFQIPKRHGGLRTINAPKEDLMRDMRAIASLIQATDFKTHDSAWAYVKGRDVVGAMRQHVQNQSHWYLKLDLTNFFGSCNKEFFHQQLSQVYPFCRWENDLDKLFDFASLDGGLPQGTPLSPLLTNAIMVPIDYKMTQLLNNCVYNPDDEAPDEKHFLPKQRYVYTRYADDVIISAKTKFDYKKLIEAIKTEVLNNTPLVLNESKTRFATNCGRNWNLGVMCNQDNNITIGYKRKKYIKNLTHYFMKEKLEGNMLPLDELQNYLGLLAWLEHVERAYYENLMVYFKNKYNVDIKQAVIHDIKEHN